MDVMKSTVVLLNCFLVVSCCGIYEKESLSQCRDFLIYLQTLFDFYSGIDLIFSIPIVKKFETESRIENLVRLINDGPIKFQIQIFNFEPGQKLNIGDGLIKVLLYDTMNMNEFLKSKGEILESKYTWIFLGKGETVWIKSAKLNFNSHVVLAKSVKDEIIMTSVTGKNGKIIFSPSGRWKNEDKEPFDSDIDYDVEDYEVALLIPHDPPFTIVHKESDGNTTVTGYLMDIWNGYEEFLGIKSNILISNKTNGGTIVKGNWTGIIGEMISTNREVALVAKPETLEISHLFDSLSLINLRLAMYQRRDEPNTWKMATEVTSNMIPFFLIILGAMGGLMLSLLGIERRESFFMVFTIYLQQSCSRLPKRWSGRIATLSLILMMLYVVTVNIGDITSLLIRNKFAVITDIKELIDPANKVIIVSQSTTHHILKDANDQTLTKIYERVQITNGYVANVSEGLKRVLNKGAIFLETSQKADFFMNGYEEKIVKTLTRYNIPGGLLIKKNTVLTKRLYYKLLTFREIGFLSKVAAQWWREENQLPFRYNPVDVSNSWQLFANFHLGVFISFLVFTLEKYYYRVHRTNLYR